MFSECEDSPDGFLMNSFRGWFYLLISSLLAQITNEGLSRQPTLAESGKSRSYPNNLWASKYVARRSWTTENSTIF